MWFFIILISSLIISSIFTNFKYIEKPMTLDPYISYVVLQNLILPIGILFFINLYKVAPFRFKGIVIIFEVILSIMVERIVEMVGVMNYVEWNVGFSILLWSSVFLFSIAFYYFIHSDFLKRSPSNV